MRAEIVKVLKTHLGWTQFEGSIPSIADDVMGVVEARPEKALGFKTPDELLTAICKVMGADRNKVLSPCRRKEVVKVRVFFYYLGKSIGFTQDDMALLTRRNHATVSHNLNYLNALLDDTKLWYDPVLSDEIYDIKRKLITC